METKRINQGGAGAQGLGGPDELKSQTLRNQGPKEQSRGPVKAGAQKDYELTLSPEAQVLSQSKAKAQEIALGTSPIREDRVAELKRKISTGEYKPDSGKIADGMINEATKEYYAQHPEEFWSKS